MYFKVNHYTPHAVGVMVDFKHAFANLYRRIRKRVGHSLRRAYSKGNLVPSRKQTAYQLSRTESGLLGPKRVPRPVLKQDSSCSNRQHHSGIILEQGRRHEVGLTVCPSVENPDLMFQKTGDSQSLKHSRQVNVVADKLSSLGQK